MLRSRRRREALKTPSKAPETLSLSPEGRRVTQFGNETTLLGHLAGHCSPVHDQLASILWEDGLCLFDQAAVISSQRQGDLPNLESDRFYNNLSVRKAMKARRKLLNVPRGMDVATFSVFLAQQHSAD
ncbi:hypothetical protein CCHR01_12928 [Colletotrichum chrysophilum]|uniref:Uncharacterized protein n=1 Tax=Colletotrichum chrysophilum TaxID=1836956 RepID=A0AAD9AAD1_9PEZI|nr:hypothetical protein CCHR01_12928 [Colletotrichum chrysophilum]